MEEAECPNALNGWAAIYGRELTSDEIVEIESNIRKLAEVIIEIEGKANG